MQIRGRQGIGALPALASLAKLIVKSDSVCPVSGSQGSRLRAQRPRLSASRLSGVRREEVLYRSASALSRTFFEVPLQPSAGRPSLPFRCALASGRGCILRGWRPLDNPLMRFCTGLHILYTICGFSLSFLVSMLVFHPTYSGCFRLHHTLAQGNFP